MDALSAAASGIRAAELAYDVTANNVANVSTTGFRPSRAEQAEATAGQGTTTASVEPATSQGALVRTGNATDLAVQGNGYFVLSTPQGLRFTRAGNLQVDASGTLVAADGSPVMGVTPRGALAPIQAGAGLTVQPNGAVSGGGRAVGQLALASFADPGGLEQMGGNTLAASANSGLPNVGSPGAGARGAILQGFLEASGTDVAQEQVAAMLDSAALAANVRTAQTQDQMLRGLLSV